MTASIDFHPLGKPTASKKVPEGFFESIAEKTLAEAKRREKASHRRKIVWLYFSAAASVAAILFFGLPSGTNQQDNLAPTVAIESIQNPSYQDTPTNKSAVIIPKVVPLAKMTDNKEQKKSVKTNVEDMSQLLTQLSDDDLQLMAAMIQSDPMNIEEME